MCVSSSLLWQTFYQILQSCKFKYKYIYLITRCQIRINAKRSTNEVVIWPTPVFNFYQKVILSEGFSCALYLYSILSYLDEFIVLYILIILWDSKCFTVKTDIEKVQVAVKNNNAIWNEVSISRIEMHISLEMRHCSKEHVIIFLQ